MKYELYYIAGPALVILLMNYLPPAINSSIFNLALMMDNNLCEYSYVCLFVNMYVCMEVGRQISMFICIHA